TRSPAPTGRARLQVASGASPGASGAGGGSPCTATGTSASRGDFSTRRAARSSPSTRASNATSDPTAAEDSGSSRPGPGLRPPATAPDSPASGRPPDRCANLSAVYVPGEGKSIRAGRTPRGARRGQGTPPGRGIVRELGQQVKVDSGRAWTGGPREREAERESARAGRRGLGRAAEPRGSWSAARAAREQRTGPQECLCYGMSMDDSLLESLDAGVLTLTLNRPARRNALDEALITRLHRRLAAAGEDAAVRTVVLTGAGGAFSSGADLKEAATALT